MNRPNSVEETENVELHSLDELDRPALLSDGQHPDETSQTMARALHRAERCPTSERELLRNRGCLNNE